MDRRTFISSMTLTILAAPLAAEAQPAGNMRRIGVLSAASSVSPPSPQYEAFRQGLRALGYVEGQNIALEARSAEGRPDRLSVLASELVRLKVDVVVTNGEPAIRAAKAATGTIPIVMAIVGDPVAPGFVASLARPGGNITGLTNLAAGLERKRLELLKEAVPHASRVAVLRDPENQVLDPHYWQETQQAAQALGITLHSASVRDPKEFAGAFATISRERAGALIVFADTFFTAHRTQIAQLALKHRIPTMHDTRLFVEAGGLIAYGPDVLDLWRHAAVFVDKILKGAKPGDLPVEQPTKFELVINLKTAKALGLTIPPSLLQRADQVIE
jgi:putative ABC transport system substrate-binding protein